MRIGEKLARLHRLEEAFAAEAAEDWLLERFLAGLRQLPDTLPTPSIQRDLLEIVGELTRLDQRLCWLLSVIDLPPPDRSEQVERRSTLELSLQCAISIQQGALKRAAEDLRRMAMKRPEEYAGL